MCTNGLRIGVAVLSGLAALAGSAQQVVRLDFDSGINGSINYTQQMRDQVQSIMEAQYAPFGITFTQTQPAGDHSTITFNQGSPGGLAESIDFRNTNPNDSAVVNIDGLGLDSKNYVNASANIGSHELGHLLGLRHGDSFGPIGSGVGADGPSPSSYNPVFPGPTGAIETPNHVMGTPAIGICICELHTPNWLSERSSVKLEFARSGLVVAEAPGSKSTLATAQPMQFGSMVVPNTIGEGMNAGIGDFDVDAFTVVGQLTQTNEVDLYSFEAEAGDLFNIEVMSNVLNDRLGDTFDTTLSVLDDAGNPIAYYGSVAFNDDEFETRDSILIDLTIPSDGEYYIEVSAFSGSDLGDYELFAYRFNGAVPASGVGTLLGLAGIVAGVRRRRVT